MSAIIKRYNSATGQWEAILAGEQGPQGPQGSTTVDVTSLETRDSVIQVNVDSLEAALTTEINTTNSEITSINTRATSIESDLTSLETSLSGDIVTESGRIDAILAGANANTDTFAEVVSLINTVDTTNDQAFSGYATNTDASIDSLETLTTTLNNNDITSASFNSTTGTLTLTQNDATTITASLDGRYCTTNTTYTANEMLTCIKTVDGSGNGLDADLLDGLDSSQFLRSDTNSTTTGYIGAEGFTGTGGGSLRLMLPHGASYATLTTTVTGAIKITLPQSWTDTMMRMTIKVYEYTTGESFEVVCGGYTNSGGGGIWVNTFAYIINDPQVGRNFNIRFGHDGSKCCIYIGETNSTWSYPQVTVTEFQAGYSNYSEELWNDNWSIGFATSFGTITSILSNRQVGKYVDGNLVWHAGNDGAGSGLDADLLDGQQGSYYLDYNNFTNKPTIPTNNNQLTNGAGYCTTDTNTTYTAGAGLTLTGTSFSIQNDLRGETCLIGYSTTDYIYVQNTVIDFYLDGNLDMRLENDGDLHVDGDVIAYSTTTSDERLKSDIKPITGALDIVDSLNGVGFKWKDGSRSGNADWGVIAQEVEKILPELIKETKLPTRDPHDETLYKTVRYEGLIPFLLEAIKELNQKIIDLEYKL